MNKGFTLLEVLIAVALLSISMLGIYRLSFASVSTSEYAKRKAYVNETAYQRILEQMNYKGRDFRDKKTLPDGTEIKFTSEQTRAVYEGVYEIKFTAEVKDVKSVYYYYEKQ